MAGGNRSGVKMVSAPNSSGTPNLAQRLRDATHRPRIPTHIRQRFLPQTPEMRRAIEESLRKNCFADPNKTLVHESPADYLNTPEGQTELANDLINRLQFYRQWEIPWLDSVLRLNGARVLEVGCGTGSSTVALAEQGAEVVGVDISSGALATAHDRCEAYGLHAGFLQANAAEVSQHFAGQKLDAILFCASLEHLTWEERMASLRATWDLLPENGILAVLEAPNRLWYTDIHTTSHPFYLWLPDQAAIAYTQYLDGPWHDLFTEPASEAKLHLARFGRGVSFHDFVIAWNIPPDKLPVVGYATAFHEKKWRSALARLSASGQYRKLISTAVPNVHPAFFQPSLDLAFKKLGHTSSVPDISN